MGTEASQITSLTIVYSTVYSDADQNKHQSSASLAFVRGIHRGPVNSPHKGPVTRKMFPFDDVIMYYGIITPLSTIRRMSRPCDLTDIKISNDMETISTLLETIGHHNKGKEVIPFTPVKNYKGVYKISSTKREKLTCI